MSDDMQKVTDVIRSINRAWLEGRVTDLKPFFHPEIVMVFPGFNGRASGNDAMMASFADFCTNAELHDYSESDLQVDVTGDSAVATFAFKMVYARDGRTYCSTGRDLWVFSRAHETWIATWRTMLDMQEDEISG